MREQTGGSHREQPQDADTVRSALESLRIPGRANPAANSALAALARLVAAAERTAELEAQASALNSTSAYLTLVTAEQTRIDCDRALARVEQLETALRRDGPDG